jgi:large subunit ribosomal protein L9
MKVLLLKDVYKLGRAGDVKKVADGYGRNYLLPQGLAMMATEGAMKQAERIRENAQAERARLNQELGDMAERLGELKLAFPVKAGETGKLYGSITTAMIAEAAELETGAALDKRQIDCEPIKTLGVHTAAVRLTIDLVPEVTILVHREGEPAESAYAVEEVAEEVPAFAELVEAAEEAMEAEEEMGEEVEPEPVTDAEPIAEAEPVAEAEPIAEPADEAAEAETPALEEAAEEAEAD